MDQLCWMVALKEFLAALAHWVQMALVLAFAHEKTVLIVLLDMGTLLVESATFLPKMDVLTVLMRLGRRLLAPVF
jgi:hypothetical protein